MANTKRLLLILAVFILGITIGIAHQRSESVAHAAWDTGRYLVQALEGGGYVVIDTATGAANTRRNLNPVNKTILSKFQNP